MYNVYFRCLDHELSVTEMGPSEWELDGLQEPLMITLYHHHHHHHHLFYLHLHHLYPSLTDPTTTPHPHHLLLLVKIMERVNNFANPKDEINTAS